MSLRVIGRTVFSSLIALVVLVSSLSAQDQTFGAFRIEADRETLEFALSQFENASRSQAYSSELRAQARAGAQAVRRRLLEGDFRVGDRVFVMVENQPTMTDTFVVTPERAIELPTIGVVALDGVLRVELEQYMTYQISRFVREPTVRANSAMRVAFDGYVSRPGFYLLSPELPIGEAVMAAGGPSVDARMSGLRIQRGSETVIGGEELQAALRGGLTLYEIGMRSGDEIHVPKVSAFAPGQVGRTIVGVTGLFWALSRIF